MARRYSSRGFVVAMAIAGACLTLCGPVWAEEAIPIHWEKSGASSGRPMIFLPALGFGGRIWSRVGEHFAKNHPIYIGTLAGTDGKPPISPPILDKTIEAVHELITKEGLKDSLLLGHLVGGHIAIRVAAQYPDEVGGALIMPVMVMREPLDIRATEAAKAGQVYLTLPDEMWEPAMRQQVTGVVEDPKMVDELMSMLLKADRQTYGRLLSEMLADDVEKRVPKIKAPVFLLAPIELPSKSRDADVQQNRLGEHARASVTAMRGLFPELAKCEASAMRNAKLFPMVDQPDRVIYVIERFMKKLDDPTAKWSNTIGETPYIKSPELR